MAPIQLFFALLLGALALGLAVGLVWLGFKLTVGTARGIGALFTGIFLLVQHIFRHLWGIAEELLRAAGALLAALVLPLGVVMAVARGRWNSSQHLGAEFLNELGNAAAALYRATLSHPLRLVGLGRLLEGVEQRVPEAVAATPGPDQPAEGPNKAFEGYQITGSLPAGGSGARLWVARPTEAKRAQLASQFGSCPDEVVIKAFDLGAGSTLPQIVRENRALEAARKLGLVLEHHMGSERFHYVMPYVPGADLSEVARHMHGRASAAGLDDGGLRQVADYSAGLLKILARFHSAGLWHKDIKPSNIIVGQRGVELVDLGLVTPLMSAMTLTTHGTEYYRDPEMVRQAMRGVKVHEVDGVKFDLYSAGAVLYFLIEHSFPAHGSLSAIDKRCPDALRWIVRRAMASLDSRYGSAGEMLLDLEAVRRAPDMFALKPADLPSMGGRAAQVAEAVAAGEPAPWQREPMPNGSYSRRPAPVEAGQAKEPSRSRSWVGFVLATAFLLAVGMGGLLLLFAVRSGPAATSVAIGVPSPLPVGNYERRTDGLVAELATRGEALGRFDFAEVGSDPRAQQRLMELSRGWAQFRLALLPALPSGPMPKAWGDFERRVDGLERFELLGNGFGEGASDWELLAQLRAAAGLAGVDDAAAAERLAERFQGQSGADGLLWYELRPDRNRVVWRLFLKDRTLAAVVRVLDFAWLAGASAALPLAPPAPVPPAASTAPVAPPPPVAPPAPVAPTADPVSSGSTQAEALASLGLVRIEPGTFTMGSAAGDSDEQPRRQVTISRPFWMGKFEVTQAEYEALMGKNPSEFRGADRPVTNVHWNDAMAYAKALNERQAALGRVPPGYQFRLPTEAEWEYACRAGTTTEYAFGDTLSPSAARFGSEGGTVPVGSYSPNSWGLYDMHGNVWEWCLDTYGPYERGSATDPLATGGPNRVVRGGSWISVSNNCRSACRRNEGPGNASVSCGFRVVLAPVLVQ